MMRVACIYNAASGSAVTSDDIQAAFAEAGAEVTCHDIQQGPDALLTELQKGGYGALVAAGGDGTVSTTANLATQLKLPLGVLPVGTLNHFAKDLGLPIDMKQCVHVITAGKRTSVDYCTVNGNVFLNNASIGIYPSTVLGRESRPFLGKWLAAAIAFLAALFRNHTVQVEIETSEGSRQFESPLIFVGNNHYEIEKAGFTKRSDLSAGTLFVYVVRAKRITALLLIALLSLFGMRRRKADYLQETDTSITLRSPRHHVHIALDGEVMRMNFPLKFEIHTRMLQVFSS